jgi:hypothetical protein
LSWCAGENHRARQKNGGNDTHRESILWLRVTAESLASRAES